MPRFHVPVPLAGFFAVLFLSSLAFYPAAAASLNAGVKAITLEELFPEAVFDSEVPTQVAVIGVEVGQRPLRPEEVLAFYRALADASPRARLLEYGRSHEGRPMVILAVSACGGETESNASDSVVSKASTTTIAAADTAAEVESAPTVDTTPPATDAPATSPPTTTLPPPTTTTPPTTVGRITLPPQVTPTTITPPPTTPPTTAPPATTPTTAAPPPTPTTPTTAPCRVVTLDETARRGDCGETVVFIQERLTVLGFPATADGLFGPGTEAAVKDFQTSRGLVSDGLVGPATWAALVEGGIGD